MRSSHRRVLVTFAAAVVLAAPLHECIAEQKHPAGQFAFDRPDPWSKQTLQPVLTSPDLLPLIEVKILVPAERTGLLGWFVDAATGNSFGTLAPEPADFAGSAIIVWLWFGALIRWLNLTVCL